MKKSLSIILSACFVLFSCAKQDPQLGSGEHVSGDVQAPQTEYLDYITVASPTAQLPSKTTTSDGVKVLWTNGDQIGLFVGASSEDQRFLKAIYTASLDAPAATATFGRVADPEPSQALDLYYAVYPATGIVKWGTFKAESNSSKRCYVNFPAEQTAVKGGWDNRAAILASTSATKEFAFKHVSAYLMFEVTSSTNAFVSVKVSATGGETLADNNANINFLDVISANKHAATSDKSSAVTLKTAENTSFAAGKYYVAFLPGTFSQGLTLTFTDASGKEATLTVTGPLTLDSGDVYEYGAIPALTFKETTEPEPGPAPEPFSPSVYNDGTKNVGVTFWASGNKAKVVSGAGSNLVWIPDSEAFSGAANTDTDNSSANHSYVTSLGDFSSTNYPAVSFCQNLGDGWHLPSEAELNTLFKVYYGITGDFDPALDYYKDETSQNNAAVFDALLGQCSTDDSATAYDETKLSFGQTGST